MKTGVGTRLAWSVLAAALVFFAFHLMDDNNLESGHGAALSTEP
jgi:hypothetical protein